MAQSECPYGEDPAGRGEGAFESRMAGIFLQSVPSAGSHAPLPERVESGGVEAFIETIPALLGEKLGRPPQWLVAVRSEIQRVTNAVIQAMQSRRAQFLDGSPVLSLQAVIAAAG